MKRALIFIAGVAVGSAATFLGCKKYFEQKADERINAEVADVKESYARKAACREKAEKNEEKKKEIADEIIERDRNGSVVKRVVRNETENENDISEPNEAITKLRNKYGGSEDLEKRVVIHRNVFTEFAENANEDDEIDPGGPKEGLNSAPYSISPDQFANECRYYDKVTIYIYNDEVAVEEGDQPIDDLEALVGRDWMSCFGSNGSEEDVALIRNENRGTDFELIRMDEDYIPDTMPVEDR